MEEAASFAGQLYRAEQLDALHLSLINLLEISGNGEIDLFLEQPAKNLTQKRLYLEKIIRALPCAELARFLQGKLDTEQLDFFLRRNLDGFLRQMQKAAESAVVVKLTVAVQFKEKDVQQMAAVLAKQIGQPVAVELALDHRLIGGVVVQYGNYITDYSLQARLAQFRTHWKKAAVVK